MSDIQCGPQNSVVKWWWVEKIGNMIANISTPQISIIHIKTFCDGNIK